MTENNKTDGAQDKTSAKKATPAANKRKKSSWTLERCQRSARRFPTQSEWQVGAPSSFKAAEAKGWVTDCVKHMSRTDQPKTHKKSAWSPGKIFS